MKGFRRSRAWAAVCGAGVLVLAGGFVARLHCPATVVLTNVGEGTAPDFVLRSGSAESPVRGLAPGERRFLSIGRWVVDEIEMRLEWSDPARAIHLRHTSTAGLARMEIDLDGHEVVRAHSFPSAAHR